MPTPRDTAIAWLCALAAGVACAWIGFALLLPYMQVSECIDLPAYICRNQTVPPATMLVAIVAVTSALQGVIVLGVVRRWLGLRRQGRSPRPPLWASLTAVLILGVTAVTLLLSIAMMLLV